MIVVAFVMSVRFWQKVGMVAWCVVRVLVMNVTKRAGGGINWELADGWDGWVGWVMVQISGRG